jgi:putative transposase
MTEQINLELANPPALAISQLCTLVGCSRAQYYRHRNCQQTSEPDLALRQEIREIAAAIPAYGYRRITAQLGRNNTVVNHKRVLKWMRKDRLLCVPRKAFVNTTHSQHSFAVYPNLVPSLSLNNINQLWVADITYIHLKREVFYLAVLLDAYSRRIIGWQIASSIDAQLVLAALKQALAQRTVPPGLVHHSDRGAQYASDVYVGLLKQHSIRISMSRSGNPYDNAQAERVIRTIKYEEIYLNEYEDFAEARLCIGEFLDDVYNHKRLHSKLRYLPPAEFEQSLVTKQPAPRVVSE